MIVSQNNELQLYFNHILINGSVFVNVLSVWFSQITSGCFTKLFRLVTNYGTVLKTEQFCILVVC